jgi:tRNA U34 5-carboxymethylaminomethyl modifying GTPase MnmE/TrmE
MEHLMTALLMLIPALLVFGVAYYFINKLAEGKQLSITADNRKERQKFILPMKVDAYQRLILLMERMHPNSLVMRVHLPTKNATLMQQEMLEQIRSEFEHNIAQQMYVSHKAWQMVKQTKEEVAQIIQIAGKQMTVDSTAMDLSAKIFEIAAQIDPFPTDITAHFLREEFQGIFK